MNLAFDGSVLGAGPITGVGRSFLTTLAAYARHAPGRCLLLAPADVEVPPLTAVERVATPRGAWQRQLQLPRLLRRLNAALLHSPVAAIPLRAPCPVVATVHDLPWRVALPHDEPGRGPRARLATHLALRRATAVLVPSAATAADLEAWHRARRGDATVHVVPHGVAPPHASPPQHPATAGPFLVLCDARPRKNLNRLAAAHRLARTTAPDLPEIVRLGPGATYVDEAEKSRRLHRARALLHLSLHEGFGLPVVEAFAHGCPVLAADIPSLREVAAGAALLADPRDVALMAKAMVAIHRDEPLRQRLRQAGTARAAALGPAASAAGWARIHHTILQTAGS
ncbi:MAG: glycosyltransferase family 1 protein [Planctomycetota bacterium]